MPERIQQKRIAGWRKPDNTVSVARPGRWGNPCRIGDVWQGTPIRTNLDAVVAFRQLVSGDFSYIAEVRSNLAGKNLMCFCSLDELCHADVLLEIANQID